MSRVVSTDYRLTTEERLRLLIADLLTHAGVSTDDAAIVAEILAASDLRGIESHGVARLESYYLSRIRAGVLNPKPNITTVRETPSSLVLDGDNGLGHPTSYRAMQKVIEKARVCGSAFAAVRNSNHFGIAGFYAMMALEHDMIGICATNSVRYGAPTNGRGIMLGTNPLAFAVPAKNEPAFVFDFATTTVPRGKLEVYKRKEKNLNPGWAIDVDGNPTVDPEAALKGALLPLGGFGVENGGHKGFGLGFLVDILCGVLSGGAFVNGLPAPNTPPQSGAISHFFGAIRIDAFRDAADFRQDMDVALAQMKASPKAPGADRIYTAGEIEHERALENAKNGIPIHVKVWETLREVAAKSQIPFGLDAK